MVDQTISDLTAVTLPLDGSELLEIERAGASYKIHSGDVGQSPPTAIAVTSDPIPVDVNPLGVYYEVTTSGSAGVEIINIPSLPLDANGYNGQLVGRKIIVYLKTKGDPADILQVTVAGVAVVNVFEAQRQGFWDYKTSAFGVRMGTEGTAVCLIWEGYEWTYSILAGGWADDTVFDGSGSQYFGPGSYIGSSPNTGGSATLRSASVVGDANAGPSWVQAGQSTLGRGGDAIISAGQSGGTSDGGNVHINAGTVSSGPGLPGNVILTELPTTNPLVDGALWVDPVTRIMKVSAG